jgi:arginase
MTDQNCVRIFGVPMDLGQKRRGVDMGPSALRYAGLQQKLADLGYQSYDGGNLFVPQLEEVAAEASRYGEGGKVYQLPQVAQVCQEVYQKAAHSLDEDERVIFLGGDHSVSIGTVAAVAHKWGEVGVLWVDAHADMNTPFTTPSGNIHGMALACLLGEGPIELTQISPLAPVLKPPQVAMIGLRDVDEQEKSRVIKSGIGFYTMRQIDEAGMADVAKRVLERFSHLDHIHVSPWGWDSCSWWLELPRGPLADGNSGR